MDGTEEEAWFFDGREWGELEEKALSAIQLYLAPHVLREVLHKTIIVGLWVRLEDLYMTKSLANRLNEGCTLSRWQKVFLFKNI